MAKTPKIPFLRVVAPSSLATTACAGALWAGVSEVPLSTLTAAQVDALRADDRLKVEDIERDAEPGDAAA